MTIARTIPLLAAAALVLAVPAPTGAAAGPAVTRVAGGLQTTTAFAFGAGQVFVGEVPHSGSGPGGGVFVLGHGRARRLANGPALAFGLAWHDNGLYVSTDRQLVRMSDWSGGNFRHVQVLYTGPRGFAGFNGIGFGADGRLYAGISLDEERNDHAPPDVPYGQDVVSFTAGGRGPRIVATGIRQPWQMAFPAGSSSPIVTDLGQDQPPDNDYPDFLLRVAPGQRYGFPGCTWLTAAPCRGYAKPLRVLAPHTDPMGIAIDGSRLYLVTGFAATTHRVVVLPVSARGTARTVLSSTGPAFVGLGLDGDELYVGDVAGDVYRLRV